MVHYYYRCSELQARCGVRVLDGLAHLMISKSITGKTLVNTNGRLSEPACYVRIKCGRGPYNEGREIWTFQTLRCSNIK